jgi:hypothetical protein
VTVTAPAPPASTAPSSKSDLNMRISKIHWTGETDASRTFNILENTIAFDHISGATLYVLRRKRTEDGAYPEGEIGRAASSSLSAVLTIKDKNAFEGLTYKYRIDAYADENAYKKGEQIKSETIMLTMKGTVKIKKVEAKTSKSIQLTWEKVKGATGYLIYSSRDKKNKTFTLVDTVGENRASYTHQGLKANTTYYYKIMSYKKAHWKTEPTSNWNIWVNHPGEGSDITRRERLHLNLSQFDSKTATFGSLPLSSAKYYVLQRTDRKGAPYNDVMGASIKTTDRFKLKDGKFSPGSNRYYRVIAYHNSKKDKVISMETLVTNDGSAPKGLRISTAKNKAEIILTWKKERSDITGYKIYRSTDGKRFNWVGTRGQYIGRGKGGTDYWIDQSVDSNKTYYYRVMKYKVRKDTDGLYRITYFSKPSKIVHAKTALDATARATRDYFVSNWSDVMVPAKGDSFVLNPVDSTAAVKYKLVNGKTLEIHVYFEHLGTRKERDKKLERFKDGVTNMWSGVKFPGKKPNPGDFPSSGSIAFTTKLVYHTKGDAGLGEKQKFIKVYFGGDDCSVEDCRLSAYDENDTSIHYWYHAHPHDVENNSIVWNHAKSNFAIYLPTDKDVEGNKNNSIYNKSKKKSAYNYTAGHELGHVLGLDDGYYPKEDPTVERLDASLETTKGTGIWTVDFKQLYDNIMSDAESVHQALPNDIEMILNAYAISVQHSNGEAIDSVAWQSYRDYNYHGHYKRSDRIHSAPRFVHS